MTADDPYKIFLLDTSAQTLEFINLLSVEQQSDHSHPKTSKKNTKQETAPTTKSPYPSFKFASCLVDLQVFLFGGFSSSMELSDSLRCINLATMKIEDVPTKGKGPQPRHSSNILVKFNKLFVIGGQSNTDLFV